MAILPQLLSSFPFLRFFMSFSNVSHLHFLFPFHSQSLQAETWAITIKAIDHDKDVCYINRVEYYKCINRKKHEFLVAHIYHQPSGHTAKVLVDRSPEGVSLDGNPAEHASRKASSKVGAHDQIRILGTQATKKLTDDFEPFKILSTLTFTKPPSLLEFALLLVVVHRHAPLYDVVDHQCYWYSDTVWRALGNAKYGPIKAESKHWSTRGKYGLISVGSDSLEAIEREHGEVMEAAQREAQTRKKKAEVCDSMVIV